MKGFSIKTEIEEYDTFEQFAKEAQLGEKDLVLCGEHTYKQYVEPLSLGVQTLFREKYGKGEPTAALDVTIQAQILELLSKMQKEKQTALLLITHDLSVVRSMADRIAVMYSGKIVEEAPAKELLENPLHPYTKGLMAAVARLDDDKKEFVQIPGHLPDPADKPAGCYFHPRCPYAATACKKAMPLLTQNQQGRKVRCYEAGKFKE